MNELLAQVRKRPLYVIAGLVGLFLLVQVVGRLNGGTDDAAVTDDTATTDPPAVDPSAAFTTPAIGYDTGTSYDPFAAGTDAGTGDLAQYSADGCLLPKPAVPSSYDGKGDWACNASSRAWVWVWKAAATTSGGCLLPKPTIPAAYIGKGDWACDPATHNWVWKPKAQPTTGPHIAIPKNRKFNTYALDTHGKLTKGQSRTAASAVTWKTSSPAVTKKTTQGTSMHVVQLKSGPLAGRWIATSAGSWSAS